MVSKRDIKGLQAFRDTYPHLNVMPGLVIYAGQESYRLDEFTTVWPWNALIL